MGTLVQLSHLFYFIKLNKVSVLYVVSYPSIVYMLTELCVHSTSLLDDPAALLDCILHTENIKHNPVNPV